MTHRLDSLLSAQRAIRGRFDGFRHTLQHDDRPAIDAALADFNRQLSRWADAEEKALIPALQRARIPGCDSRGELLLESVQILELARYLQKQISEGIHPGDLAGFVDNLDRRLADHEREMGRSYYPAAEKFLTPEEWNLLEMARPEE